MIIGIYKITSPSGKVYIGQSKNIESRFRQYKINDISDQPKLYNSFLKYGIARHSFEIIGTFLHNELDEKEIFYINYYNSVKEGLNCKHGGHRAGLEGESLIKLSNSLKETNKKPEVKERRAAWQRGRKMSDEAKQRMSLVRKGRIAHQNQIASAKGNNNACKGKIEIYKDEILVTTAANLYKAADFINGDPRNIHRAITNPKYIYHKGFSFKRVQ